MSQLTIKILGKHLKRLTADRMELFKKKFCKMKPPKGKEKMKTSQLKNKLAEEIADIIVQSYTVRHVLSFVKKVFQQMGLNQQRIELEKDMRQAGKKKTQKKRSAHEDQAEGSTSSKAEKKQQALEQGDNTQSNTAASQTGSMKVETKDGIPTQTQGEADSQEELNNGAPDYETEDVPMNPETEQEKNTSGTSILLTDQKEAKDDMASLGKGNEGTSNIVPILSIKQEEQETLLTQSESQEVINPQAIRNDANSELQEEKQKREDPIDDVPTGEGAEEHSENIAEGVKLHKRPPQNISVGPKQDNGQVKHPAARPGRPKRTRQQAKHDEMDSDERHERQPKKKVKQKSPPLPTRQRLLQTLEQMDKKLFKRFQTYLKDEEFLETYNYSSITTSELEDKDAIEVTDLMIRRYTTEYVLHVAYLVLDKIGEKELAKKLKPFVKVKRVKKST